MSAFDPSGHYSMDAGLGHYFSTPIIFEDLVPQGADRNPE
jgi:hypothetical protein